VDALEATAWVGYSKKAKARAILNHDHRLKLRSRARARGDAMNADFVAFVFYAALILGMFAMHRLTHGGEM
jgi:hypothetical protein